MSVLGAAGLPPIDQSLLPPDVRNGSPAAQKAYATGLAFEQVLVDQLSQELTQSVGADGSTDASSGGSSSDGVTDGSGGLLGSSDPASSTYGQLLPQALTSSIMSGGGIGIAQQLATALDPALGAPASAAGAPTTRPPAPTQAPVSPPSAQSGGVAL